MISFLKNNDKTTKKEIVIRLIEKLEQSNLGNYEKLEEIGFKNKEVYNFRGVGQIRYWTKN